MHVFYEGYIITLNNKMLSLVVILVVKVAFIAEKKIRNSRQQENIKLCY